MQCNDPFDMCQTTKRYSQRSAVSTTPHALFMDCTHDNPTPNQKRTAMDAFTTAAIVTASSCAVGSVRGFDSLVPDHLNIVFEQRHYDTTVGKVLPVERVKSIIMAVKRGNDKWMVTRTSQSDGIITICACDDKMHEYVLVAKTAFTYNESPTPYSIPQNSKMLYAGRMIVDPTGYTHNPDRITGFVGDVEELAIHEQKVVMHPGSVLFIQLMPHDSNDAIDALEKYYTDATLLNGLSHLNIAEFNMLLYRTEAEERDMTPPYGVYVVPELGPLPYCGIAGFALPIMQHNYGVMHHSDPFTSNASQGSWMLEYTVERLKARHFDAGIVDTLQAWFDLIKKLPDHQRGKETIRAILHLYQACMNRLRVILGAQSDLDFWLSLGLVQMYGRVESTGYHPQPNMSSASLAAGLPHFATHHMRCWGRDTFTAYKGFFLQSRRFEEGRQVIQAFASCLYNGLIPNLLDARRFPRFNSRDAVWWFLYALCEHAIVDAGILEEKVAMRFLANNQYQYTDYHDWQTSEHEEMTMSEIIKEILKCHWKGISFVEPNAGPQLDAHMSPNGFSVTTNVDQRTGLIYGGNEHNCGTWMDKMGHVEGVNKGLPATSRHGAAIEINALCLYSLKKVKTIIGDFEIGDGKKLSDWHDLLSSHFDGAFWDPQNKCFKDCLDSRQIRPNFLIATALLQDYLPSEHVTLSLQTAIDHLLSKDPRAIGMRTLSNQDPLYSPNYLLHDPTGGHNYHNGPEWPWLTGFLLLSIKRHSHFRTIYDDIIMRIQKHLLCSNPYGGIVELTNQDGMWCEHSCTTQAWSMACIRQALAE